MRVTLSEHRFFQLFRSNFTGNRHQTDVYQIGAAGTAKMSVGEAENGIFVVIVARARIPSDHLFGIRAQLHHTLRHSGAGEGASAKRTCLVGLRSDERIDKFSVIVALRKHQNRHQ